MSARAPELLQSNKALPSIAKESLPRTPRPHPGDNFPLPPQPPPKQFPDQEKPPQHANGQHPLVIDVGLSNGSSGQDDLTHSLPISPSPDGRTKRLNPLVDLIESEKVYVDQLTGIIRKVASAWSRNNLPPHDLDLMFRSIEGVYKADRSLLSRLKEIGTSPSSPKALGDLLMRWIDQLEAPYTLYAERYCVDFDTWEPVRGNSRLPDVLATFSSTCPPSLAGSDSSVWTLDELFLLPKGRLKYFKKLYGRLLKGTQPGRSDHKLLASASEKLDKMLSLLDARANIKAGSSTPAALETEDEVVVDLRSPAEPPKMQEVPTPTGSETSSARGSSLSSPARSSNVTSVSSIPRSSIGDLSSISLMDLENRLAAERCIDIFTMKPKPVRLQILPPSLPYARTMRIGVETTVRFIPRSTGFEINHAEGRVFILSDLFLLCEQMAPGEKSTESPGADLWLLYPPLAGKHLKVAKIEGEERAVEVTVLRKEKLILTFSSPAIQESVLSALNECIEFASAVHAASKHPLPPMPKLNNVPKPPRDGIPSSQTAPDLHQSNTLPQSSRSPSPHRISSPIGSFSGSASRQGSGPPSRNSHDIAPGPLMSPTGMSSPAHSLEAQTQQGGGWTQPAHDPHSAQKYPGRQPSQPDVLNNSVGHPQFASGTPLGPAPIPQSPPAQSMAPAPRTGPLPGQIVSPGQFFPLQRATSAEPIGRRGPPLGLAHAQQPMHGADPSFAQRGPQRLPSSHMNGPFVPPNSSYAAPTSLSPPEQPFQGGLRKSPSAFNLTSHPEQGHTPPFDVPPRPGMASSPMPQPRAHSMGSMGEQLRAVLPSAQFRAPSVGVGSPSPPTSPPMNNRALTGPVTSTISAQMKCKVFLKQGHAQWKSLGSAKLKLYCEHPTNVKQLVVEAEDKNKSVLISTIVLTDGVERVGKTGVAVELSDKGARTGIIYMIQLRTEQATVGLYEGLLAGSDRNVIM